MQKAYGNFFSSYCHFPETLHMVNDLKPYEDITRVFWIKIELKDHYGKDPQDLGEIRDVISGIKRPMEDLLDIIDFIVPYMQQMGIRIRWSWQFTLWIRTVVSISVKKKETNKASSRG